jgi:Fe2+ or Zn2+ uptake regulation protein
MAATAMIHRSILESGMPEAKTMYRNLHNFVERAAVQQVEIDRQFSLGIESHGPQTASSWSMGHNPPSP